MSNNIISQLSEREQKTIKECLYAAAFTDEFFPDWEFSILFGLSRDEVKTVANAWPNVDFNNVETCCAIIGALNLLLGYPHGQDGEIWDSYITVSRPIVRATLEKLIDLGL